METTITVRDLHKHVSEFLGRVRHGNETFIVTSRGHPVAALVPIADLERLEGNVKSIESMTRNADHEQARKPFVSSDAVETLSRRHANAALSECGGNVGTARRVLLEALLRLENSEV